MSVLRKLLFAATYDGDHRVPLALGRLGSVMVMHAKLYCDRGFDRRYHTDTAGSIGVDAFEVSSPNRRHAGFYAPTPVSVFRKLMRYVPGPFDDFVFIDVGAGKGRVVMAATGYRFREVVGVEFVEELCRVANRNLVAFKKAHPSTAARIVCADIADYELPPQNSVIYMYNPFFAPMANLFVRRLRDSLAAAPRKLYVIYYNDVTGAFDGTDFLRLRRKGKLLFDMTSGKSKPYSIYETV